MKLDQRRKILLGESGELLVASRLLAHGLVAGQLPRGFKADDLYVESNHQLLYIQVKTRVGPLDWPVGDVEVRPDRYYALVNFKDTKSASLVGGTIYVLSSAAVAKAVALHAKVYLRAHPKQVGKGVPNVADSWRMNDEMVKHGYGPGWLERYREAWTRFIDGTLD